MPARDPLGGPRRDGRGPSRPNTPHVECWGLRHATILDITKEMRGGAQKVADGSTPISEGHGGAESPLSTITVVTTITAGASGIPSESALPRRWRTPSSGASPLKRTLLRIRPIPQNSNPKRQEKPTVARPAKGPVHTPMAESSLTSPPPTPDPPPSRAERAAARSMTASTLRQPSRAFTMSGVALPPASTPARTRAAPEHATAKTHPFGMILQLRSVAEATPSAAASVARHATPSTADKTPIPSPSPRVRGILGNPPPTRCSKRGASRTQAHGQANLPAHEPANCRQSFFSGVGKRHVLKGERSWGRGQEGPVRRVVCLCQDQAERVYFFSLLAMRRHRT